jgi:hypothetical protein
MGPYRKELLPDGAGIDYGPIGMRMMEPCAYDGHQVRRDRLLYRKAHLEQAERALAAFRHAGAALDQGGSVMQFSAPRWNDAFGPQPVDEHGQATLAAAVARLTKIIALRKAALAREERTGKAHPLEWHLRLEESLLKAARAALRRLEAGDSPASVWDDDYLSGRPDPLTRESAERRVRWLVQAREKRLRQLEDQLSRCEEQCHEESLA